MKRKITAVAATVLTIIGVAMVNPAPAMALGGGNCGTGDFLGFRPWYEGLCSGSEISQPAKGDEKELALFVWTIVLNVTFDLILAVGYIAIGFIIYGGLLYIMSQGDPARLARGKKTLMSAIIGTIIAMVATVAVNTIKVVLGITSNDVTSLDFSQDTIKGAFAWAYTVAGLIAVIYIVKGGMDYLIAHGDPGRLRMATQTIIYAVVGLIIVLLAAVITAFVTSSTGEAL